LGIDYLLVSYCQVVQGKKTLTSHHEVQEGTTMKKSFGVKKEINYPKSWIRGYLRRIVSGFNKKIRSWTDTVYIVVDK